MIAGLKAALHLVYPPQCLSCNAAVAEDFGLCGACWRATPLVAGLCCALCGLPLPGEAGAAAVHCDDCLALPRPWTAGRAAMVYRDKGREMVLALKHADRTDLAAPAARWMQRAAGPLLHPGVLIVPVPLHWKRLFRRRYNQAALLSRALARLSGAEHCPDLLVRRRDTATQEGRDRDDRFRNVTGAFAVHPRRGGLVTGRDVLLVDDVMTTGATLAAAAGACNAGGAASVSVLVLARVGRTG